jgi:hypothetical protein
VGLVVVAAIVAVASGVADAAGVTDAAGGPGPLLSTPATQ